MTNVVAFPPKPTRLPNGMVPAYLLNLTLIGNIDHNVRILINAETWDWLDRGGPIPECVMAAGARDPDLPPAEFRAELEAAGDFRERVFRVHPSLFDGEMCHAEDINEFVSFIHRHNIYIEREYWDDNGDLV